MYIVRFGTLTMVSCHRHTQPVAGLQGLLSFSQLHPWLLASMIVLCIGLFAFLLQPLSYNYVAEVADCIKPLSCVSAL